MTQQILTNCKCGQLVGILSVGHSAEDVQAGHTSSWMTYKEDKRKSKYWVKGGGAHWKRGIRRNILWRMLLLLSSSSPRSILSKWARVKSHSPFIVAALFEMLPLANFCWSKSKSNFYKSNCQEFVCGMMKSCGNFFLKVELKILWFGSACSDWKGTTCCFVFWENIATIAFSVDQNETVEKSGSEKSGMASVEGSNISV